MYECVHGIDGGAMELEGRKTEDNSFRCLSFVKA